MGAVSYTHLLGRGTFNDETGKFHTSYASYENGVATVTGVTLDTNIKLGSTSEGMGYPGAFVYQYEDQFWATLGYHAYEFTLGSSYIAPVSYTHLDVYKRQEYDTNYYLF